MEVKSEPKSAAERKVADARDVKAIIDELLTLSERVKQGDPQAEAQVVSLLDENPELVEEIGDLSKRAMQSLLIEAAGDVFAIKLSILRREAALRRQLVPQDATVLEKWAADSVIVAMQLQQFADLSCASAARRGGRLNAWVKIQEAASKRVDRSLKNLGLVRQLAALPGRTITGSERSSTQATPIVAAPGQSPADNQRTSSKPVKKVADTIPEEKVVECAEEIHCGTPARPVGPLLNHRRPANRIAQLVGASPAPASVNGHVNH